MTFEVNARFNIGDEVRLLDSSEYASTLRVNAIRATITRAGIEVLYSIVNDSCAWRAIAEDLELVPPKEKPIP